MEKTKATVSAAKTVNFTLLSSFNVAMVIDPIELKTTIDTLKEEGAFDVTVVYIYTKSSTPNKGKDFFTFFSTSKLLNLRITENNFLVVLNTCCLD